MSPLEKKNVYGSFIFISYWLISHAILSINWSRHNYPHFLLAVIIKIPTQPIRSAALVDVAAEFYGHFQKMPANF